MNDRLNQPHDSNAQLLYVTLILDESGSMKSCKGAAIAGFNQYITILRYDRAETRLTLTLFNSKKTEVRYRDDAMAVVQPLTDETYQPGHATPLYDAIGHTLSAARRAAPAEAKKLCVILTDGEENASQNYTRSKVFGMIDDFKKQGWTFLYLGADHDVWAAGESLGIKQENRVAFSKEDVGNIFCLLSENTSRYRRRKPLEEGPVWENKSFDQPSTESGSRRSRHS